MTNTPETPPAPEALPQAQAPARPSLVWRLLHSGLRTTAATVAVLGLAAAGAGSWVWTSAAGTAWALGLVPGLQVQGLQGALGRGNFTAAKLHFITSGGVLDVTDLQATGLQWHWRPQPGAWVGLQMQTLQTGPVHWQSGAASGKPAPTDLHLPLELAVGSARIASLTVDRLPTLTDLQAALHLGADGGSAHTVTGLRFALDRLQTQANLRIATAAPLAVNADLSLQSLAGAARPWQATLQTQGPLASLQARVHLSGSAAAGQKPPALDIAANLRPFAAWPLGPLTLRTEALDLSTLHSGAPKTLLSGTAQIDSAGLRQPLHLQLLLSNQAPGRWDQGALPITLVDLDALGEPATDTPKGTAANQPSLEKITLQRFKAELASQGNAGPPQVSLSPSGGGSGTARPWGRSDRGDLAQITGTGQWLHAGTVGEAQASFNVSNLHPVALDKRLAPMRLSGPVKLSLQGLPPPSVLLGVAAAPTTPKLDVDARLRGHLDAAAGGSPEVELRMDASLGPNRIELRELKAQAAGAQALLQGTLDQTAPQRWHWQLAGQLQDFDPRPWWPFAEGSPWAKGPHRLNAKLDSNASAPLAALASLGRQPREALAQFDGQLSLNMAPSQLAGVAVMGELRLDSHAATPLTSQWQVAGNSLSLQARNAIGSPGEHWQLAVQAPALAGLAPLLALDDELKTRVPSAGRIEAQLSADGRGQAWQWQGKVLASGLSGKGYLAESINLSGQGGSTLDAPLDIKLQAQGLQQGAARIDLFSATLTGSAHEHQLALQLESPARPPEWFEQVLAARTGSGTRVQASATGRWQPEANAKAGSSAGQWQGRITDLQGRARDGSGQPWLAGQDVRLALSLNDTGTLQSFSAEPGRIVLPGTALRWTTMQYEARPGQPLPRLVVQAQIEPFALAPLLARAQPELGWRGDLTLAGDIQINSGERFDADLVFERRSGDLSVADDVRDLSGHIQSLGLSDLRLGLSAHDGNWAFTEALAGKQLGEMAGVASVHARADQVWPSAQAALDGVLQMRVANLAAWGAWVPPGWRLGGELSTSAKLGGRFGAPEFTGQLTGRNLSAHHALLGVQLSDGQVDMVLQGDKAHINQFAFKGGEGQLSVQGDATLGEAPQVQLALLADHFLLLGRVDRRLVTSGRASLLLNRDAMKLDGQLKVDEGLIDFSRGGAPGLDDDVTVVDSRVHPTDPDAPVVAAKPARPVLLSAKLDLGNALRIKGRGLDTRLRGELRLNNPGDKLAVNGKVRTDDGTYAAYGQKLEIERGELSFNGPVEDPQLDILAVRPNLDIKVGVAVTGSAMNPRVRLASDPEMADADKLSWLMLGRAPEGLGKADTALLQRAAMALLAGEGEAPTDAILGALGITDFGVRQTTEGNVQDTVVSLGKQLGRHWYVGYERGVNATTGTWQLIYRLAQRFTLRAQSGSDNALDLIWSWRLK
jgi:translocation and assembly module TamB